MPAGLHRFLTQAQLEDIVPSNLALTSGLMTRKGGAGRLFLIFMDDFLPLHGTEEASLITPLDFIASAFLKTLTKAFGGD